MGFILHKMETKNIYMCPKKITNNTNTNTNTNININNTTQKTMNSDANTFNTYNNITSLFVHNIHPSTTKTYIFQIFSKIGKIHKINYQSGKTAHVHLNYWYDVNPKISALKTQIVEGKTIPIVHDTINYWKTQLFDSTKTNKNKDDTLREIYEFVTKNNIQLTKKQTEVKVQGLQVQVQS